MIWIQDWVRTIIILVFFAGFLELLLPSGNMKPTVQVLVGLFVLILMLGPVSSLIAHLQGEPNLELPMVADEQTADVLAQGEGLRSKQLERILNQYRDNVEQQVKSLLKLHNDNADATVTVDVIDDVSQTSFGQLRSLEVVIQTKEWREEAIDTDELVMFLADFYGLEKDKVKITVVK